MVPVAGGAINRGRKTGRGHDGKPRFLQRNGSLCKQLPHDLCGSGRRLWNAGAERCCRRPVRVTGRFLTGAALRRSPASMIVAGTGPFRPPIPPNKPSTPPPIIGNPSEVRQKDVVGRCRSDYPRSEKSRWMGPDGAKRADPTGLGPDRRDRQSINRADAARKQTANRILHLPASGHSIVDLATSLRFPSASRCTGRADWGD